MSRVTVTTRMKLFLVLVISCLGGHCALGQTNDNKFISHLLKGCSVNNGGCEHVCIRTDPHSCRCRKGYVINDDGRTCSGRSHIRARFDIPALASHSVSQVSFKVTIYSVACLKWTYLCEDEFLA